MTTETLTEDDVDEVRRFRSPLGLLLGADCPGPCRETRLHGDLGLRLLVALPAARPLRAARPAHQTLMLPCASPALTARSFRPSA